MSSSPLQQQALGPPSEGEPAPPMGTSAPAPGPARAPRDPAVFDPSQSFFPRALLESESRVAELRAPPPARLPARKLLVAALLAAGAGLGYYLWQNASEVRSPAVAAPSSAPATTAASPAATAASPATTAASPAPTVASPAATAAPPASLSRADAVAPKAGASSGPITPAAVRPRRASPAEEPSSPSRPSVTHTKSTGSATGARSAAEVAPAASGAPARAAIPSAEPPVAPRDACREELAALGLCKPTIQKEGN